MQTGDPTGTGKGGTSIWGRKFEDEFKEELKVSVYLEYDIYLLFHTDTTIITVFYIECFVLKILRVLLLMKFKAKPLPGLPFTPKIQHNKVTKI